MTATREKQNIKTTKTACAIICEYDPFHTGHKYQIEQAKLQSGCDYIVCIMSGSITQRGNLPLIDKYQRAKYALQNGASLVVQLPATFSCTNAQIFASASIKIAQQLEFVTHLAFGVEHDNIQNLDYIAQLSQDQDFLNEIKTSMKTGVSYASAMQTCIDKRNVDSNKEKTKLKSNAILAIEYIKALKKYRSNIIPVPICRTNDFDSLSIDNTHASASAIRHFVLANNIENIKKFLPYDVIFDNLPNKKICDGILLNFLKNTTMSHLSQVFEFNEGLDFSVFSKVKGISSLDKLIECLTSKRYNSLKIKRGILQAYFGITRSLLDCTLEKNNKIPFRVLGVSKECIDIFSQLPKHSLITNNDVNAHMQNQVIDIDIIADNLYSVCASIDKDLYYANSVIKV